MSRIFWDTNLFIYSYELNPEFSPMTWGLLERMEERGDQLLTSWMTVAEVQVQPWKLGDKVTCEKYKRTIVNTATVVVFDEKAAENYVLIRATTGVRGADAIQLACAAAAGVELFVTNDNRLSGVSVPGIHFIVPLDRVPV